MFKVNNKDTRRRSGDFIVNFEHVIADCVRIKIFEC